MTNITAVLTHTERLAPGFTKQIRGAPQAEIEKLQRLSEVTLPNNYVDYLRFMGAHDGGLTWGYAGMDLRIDKIISYYESVGWRPPRPYLLIGRDEENRPWSTFLSCARAGQASIVQFNIPDGPAGIVDAPDGAVQLIASSLAQLIFRCAFTNLICYEFNYELYGRIFKPHPEEYQYITDCLRSFGCQLHPLSEPGGSYYLTDRSAVLYIQSAADHPTLMYMYSDDNLWLERVQRELSRRVALETHWLEATPVVHLGVTERPTRGYFNKVA